MKTAIATTTVHVPVALELMRAHGPDVGFFVAGDQKSPHNEIEELANRVGGYFNYLSPDAQTKWKCSELIGWGTLARRNIATLEAIAWGADVIVVWDNDNIPLRSQGSFLYQYFGEFESVLNILNGMYSTETGEKCRNKWSGCKVSSPTGWFDVGTLLEPRAPHRGFPHDIESQTIVTHVVGARVGVAAGICLGDPDIDAVQRMANHPEVHRVSELLNSGIVVDTSPACGGQATHTVFNSQNTAFIRELAPAMFMMPGVGRHDDIYASLITQRVMRERNLHVHFGKPFVWQQRNPHNLISDLRKEIDGMENVKDFAQVLDSIALDSRGPYHLTKEIWSYLASSDLVPKKAVEAAFAFLEDIEGLL